MLEFIPFIPQHTPGLSDIVWHTALKSWNANLTQLLSMEDHVFYKQLTFDSSVFTFIDQVLHEHMNNTLDTVDTSLLKHIFLFYAKLFALPVLDDTLLTMERMVNFLVVYGESNGKQVRDFVDMALQKLDTLEQTVISTIGMLMDAIQSIPDLLSKSASLDTLNRAHVLVRVLDALLLSTVHNINIKESFDTLDIVLIDCYNELIPSLIHAVKQDELNAGYAYSIKYALVSCFNSYADAHFFIPLGYISSLQDHTQLEPLKQGPQDTSLDLLSEKILNYIETSGLDSTKTAFENGPLILDWQVEYHIQEKLGYINVHAHEGQEERLSFLELSMEQVKYAVDHMGDWNRFVQKRLPTMVTEVGFEDSERISLISSIHDLFPDLGEGFIEACLEYNNNDSEAAIMQLVEDNLPPSLASLDRTMERKPLMSAKDTVDELIHLEKEPVENVLASRRNVYDNDEFDVFAHRTVDTSKVYVGKKDKANADALLEDKTFIQETKKNVLQRVVDMYDDDYDDSYDDINDAGVPATMETGDAALDIVKKKNEAVDPSIQNESVLVHAFAQQPDLFNRDSATRKSKKRIELIKKTGMSQEQLEGWAKMFTNNPRKDRILDKYMLFDGHQVDIAVHKTEARKEAVEKEVKKTPAQEAKDKAYKDKNKARFGNHNRKANRDKKIAKTAPPPS